MDRGGETQRNGDRRERERDTNHSHTERPTAEPVTETHTEIGQRQT